MVYEKVLANKQQPDWEEIGNWPEKAKVLWWQWSRLSVRDGILCRKWESVDGKEISWQIIVPKRARQECIRKMHEGMTGCHLEVVRRVSR